MPMISPRPAVSLRHRLQAASIEIVPAHVVPKGRVMWWRGANKVGVDDLSKVDTPFPSGATAVWLSPADYAEIMGK